MTATKAKKTNVKDKGATITAIRRQHEALRAIISNHGDDVRDQVFPALKGCYSGGDDLDLLSDSHRFKRRIKPFLSEADSKTILDIQKRAGKIASRYRNAFRKAWDEREAWEEKVRAIRHDVYEAKEARLLQARVTCLSNEELAELRKISSLDQFIEQLVKLGWPQSLFKKYMPKV